MLPPVGPLGLLASGYQGVSVTHTPLRMGYPPHSAVHRWSKPSHTCPACRHRWATFRQPRHRDIRTGWSAMPRTTPNDIGAANPRYPGFQAVAEVETSHRPWLSEKHVLRADMSRCRDPSTVPPQF